VGIDIAAGLLIAGALAAWVPDSFWRELFLQHHGAWSTLWGPLIGPAVAIVSFVCSIGNVPMAAVLWNGGISFGGVLAFIFADLIILPILNIYRKYYGAKVALYLLVVSYITMVIAGLAIGGLFGVLGHVPTDRTVTVFDTTISWNADTFLDIVLLVLTAVLGRRFLRTGGMEMLRMMNVPPPESGRGHAHTSHAAEAH
jgi:uncharacterized membrane protein YraQ (UPF0718 family)